jgi:hypothetical protein
MQIFTPAPENLGFDHDYPRGMTLALVVAMAAAVALSLATMIGIVITIWSFFHA